MKETIDLHLTILILALGPAAVSDINLYRISNRLFIAGAAAVTFAHFVETRVPERSALAAGLLFLLLLVWLFSRHMAGGADVKLCAFVIYALPDGQGLRILVSGFVLAAVYGVWKLWKNGLWEARVRHLLTCLKRSAAGERYVYYLRERDGTEAAVPMAACMLAAACLSAVLF